VSSRRSRVTSRSVVASCLLAIFAVASLVPSLRVPVVDRNDNDDDDGAVVEAAGPVASAVRAVLCPASGDDTADDDDDDSAVVPTTTTIDVRPVDSGMTFVTLFSERPRRTSVTPRDLERGPPRI